MAADPLVTTIIPTFNRADLVCDAIESVRRQTYRNVEIIVVDDGSTDDTQAVLKAYGTSLRVIVQDNAGPAAARNRGLAAARGDVITFLDSDDTWTPTKLDKQVSFLSRVDGDVTCCLCNGWIVGNDSRGVLTFDYADLRPSGDEGVWANVSEVLITRFVMFTQMVAVRRQVLERIGGFDETLWVLEDYDLALRLSLEGPWGYIREPLVVYRQGSPLSLAAAAEVEQVRLRECLVRVRQNLWQKVKSSERHRHLRKPFLKELQVSRRLLWATQLSRRASLAVSILGHGALRVERYLRAIRRRTPWYPQMEVVPITGRLSQEIPYSDTGRMAS